MTDLSIGMYDNQQFADNPEPRCPVVLVLDVSGSMSGKKIDAVNQGLRQFAHDIKEDDLTALRADVAIIEFDHEARVIQDFVSGQDLEPPTLKCKGGTIFSTPINLALDLTETRKQTYRDTGVAYYRSLVYFLTDGYPQHEKPGAIENITARLRQQEEGRHIAFLCFGINSPNQPADMDTLNAMAPRGAVALTNNEQLSGSLEWLSQSVAAVSQSQPGDSLTLPSPGFLQF